MPIESRPAKALAGALALALATWGGSAAEAAVRAATDGAATTAFVSPAGVEVAEATTAPTTATDAEADSTATDATATDVEPAVMEATVTDGGTHERRGLFRWLHRDRKDRKERKEGRRRLFSNMVDPAEIEGPTEPNIEAPGDMPLGAARVDGPDAVPGRIEMGSAEDPDAPGAMPTGPEGPRGTTVIHIGTGSRADRPEAPGEMPWRGGTAPAGAAPGRSPNFLVRGVQRLLGAKPMEASEPSAAAVAAAAASNSRSSRRRPQTGMQVNSYIWRASLDVLSFLPIEAVDPFSGVIATGWGRPPGGDRDYRATVIVQDSALDARSLKLALSSRSGDVDRDTVRAVEDAILTRARQMRIESAQN